MKVLGLDTSTPRFSLAVADGERVLKSRNMVLKKVLSDSIMPAIQKILQESGISLAKIDVLAVGLGPGSFTSLRVGVSTVKALAFAAGKPIVGVPSLDAIAMNVVNLRKNICVLSDARRGLVYANFYRVADGFPIRAGADLLVPITDVLDRVEDDTVFVGDALAIYRPNIELYFSTKTSCPDISFAAASRAVPLAKNIIALASLKIHKQEFADIDRIVPLYLYPEDCQVSSVAKSGGSVQSLPKKDA